MHVPAPLHAPPHPVKLAVLCDDRAGILKQITAIISDVQAVTAELRDLALSGRTPQQSYDGIAWLYGGP